MNSSLHHLMEPYYQESQDKVSLLWQENLKNLRLSKSHLRFRSSSKQNKKEDSMKPSELELLHRLHQSNNSNMEKLFIKYQLKKKHKLVHLLNVLSKCFRMSNTVGLKDQNGKLKLNLLLLNNEIYFFLIFIKLNFYLK